MPTETKATSTTIVNINTGASPTTSAAPSSSSTTTTAQSSLSTQSQSIGSTNTSTSSTSSTSTKSITSSDTSAGSSLTSSIIIASQTSQSQSQPSETSTPNFGLSPGAKAGIGIGAALGFLVILGLVTFAFWYGRRSARAAAGKNKDNPDDMVGVKPELAAGTAIATELDAKPLDRNGNVVFYDAEKTAELEGALAVGEIGSSPRPVEMESRHAAS